MLQDHSKANVESECCLLRVCIYTGLCPVREGGLSLLRVDCDLRLCCVQVAEDIKRPDTTQPAARNDASVDSDASFFLLSKGLPRDFFRCLNVLEDSEMREGVKRYTSWPTIPQLFISQTFLGGLDVATEMFKDRSLHKEMEKALQEHYRRTESSSEVSSVEDAQ